jgi:hypothetical protein
MNVWHYRYIVKDGLTSLNCEAILLAFRKAFVIFTLVFLKLAVLT